MSRRQWLAATLLALLWGAVASAEVVKVRRCEGKATADAIRQARAGDTVQLPEGTIELSEPILPKSGIRLLGMGQEKTILVYQGAAKPSALITFDGCEDVEVAHLTIDGRNNPLVHQGISGKNSRRLWLHHLTIRNLKAQSGGPQGIHFSGRDPTMEGGVTDSRISDCLVEDIGLESAWGSGIRLSWGSDRNQVVGNIVRRTGRGGIFGNHSAELIIRNNRVSGSGGSGLGVEIWGGCPRSLIEDNQIDHWLSVDRGDRSAVRRNFIGTDDGTLKGIGIEIIARDMIVTDNVVRRGARIGLSVSNTPVKNNVYWAYNQISDCVQWGAQLQGETGGIAHHYFYRCEFLHTVRGDPRARYAEAAGNGFRTNGNCRGLIFDHCMFTGNGGFGLQFGGPNIDAIALLDCAITGNKLKAFSGPRHYSALAITGCKVQGNEADELPPLKPFPGPAPLADFRLPAVIRAESPAAFRDLSPAGGEIVERLWDFGEGIPETSAAPEHIFPQAGTYRVTLVVWNAAGQGARMEKMVRVLPKS